MPLQFRVQLQKIFLFQKFSVFFSDFGVFALKLFVDPNGNRIFDLFLQSCDSVPGDFFLFSQICQFFSDFQFHFTNFFFDFRVFGSQIGLEFAQSVVPAIHRRFVDSGGDVAPSLFGQSSTDFRFIFAQSVQQTLKNFHSKLIFNERKEQKEYSQ